MRSSWMVWIQHENIYSSCNNTASFIFYGQSLVDEKYTYTIREKKTQAKNTHTENKIIWEIDFYVGICVNFQGNYLGFNIFIFQFSII